MSILGWWLASGAACNFIASLILSIVTLWYPGYEIQNWQQWLVYVGVVWLAVALNTWGSQLLPLYNRFNCEQPSNRCLTPVLLRWILNLTLNPIGSPRRMHHSHRNNGHTIRV